MVGGKYTELGDPLTMIKTELLLQRLSSILSKVKLAQIGTYQVTYSVKDSAGNADTVTRSVQINGNAPVIGTISGNKETCIMWRQYFGFGHRVAAIKISMDEGTAAAPGNSTDSIIQ